MRNWHRITMGAGIGLAVLAASSFEASAQSPKTNKGFEKFTIDVVKDERERNDAACRRQYGLDFYYAAWDGRCHSRTSRVSLILIEPRAGDATRPIEFFGGIEGGVSFSNTTFLTAPSFDVSGNGGVLGLNAGFLARIGQSPVSVGPRFGWIGSNISGTTEGPLASPFFDYQVKTRNMFYEEAFIRFAGFTPSPRPQDRVFFNYNYFVTASLGVAQVQNDVIATSGAFRVIDSYTATGATASIGLGVPIYRTIDGINIDATGQYRAVFLPQVDVQVPGKVATDFWAQGVTFGLDFRY